jgi:hypothetical protein
MHRKGVVPPAPAACAAQAPPPASAAAVITIMSLRIGFLHLSFVPVRDTDA